MTVEVLELHRERHQHYMLHLNYSLHPPPPPSPKSRASWQKDEPITKYNLHVFCLCLFHQYILLKFLCWWPFCLLISLLFRWQCTNTTQHQKCYFKSVSMSGCYCWKHIHTQRNGHTHTQAHTHMYFYLHQWWSCVVLVHPGQKTRRTSARDNPTKSCQPQSLQNSVLPKPKHDHRSTPCNSSKSKAQTHSDWSTRQVDRSKSDSDWGESKLCVCVSFSIFKQRYCVTSMCSSHPSMSYSSTSVKHLVAQCLVCAFSLSTSKYWLDQGTECRFCGPQMNRTYH